jgi:hypothetical protein
VGLWALFFQPYVQSFGQAYDPYGPYYDPWPLMSLFLFTGIFLFSLSLVPAYLLSVDDARAGPGPDLPPRVSLWAEFNTP